MKIQLKRSNVLEGGSAKAPTSAQMEYGELAVNYNASDPVIFIKDSSNEIIRLTNNEEEVRVEAGNGLTSIDNADNIRILSVEADPGYAIDVTASGLRFGDDWTNIPVLV